MVRGLGSERAGVGASFLAKQMRKCQRSEAAGVAAQERPPSQLKHGLTFSSLDHILNQAFGKDRASLHVEKRIAGQYHLAEVRPDALRAVALFLIQHVLCSKK